MSTDAQQVGADTGPDAGEPATETIEPGLAGTRPDASTPPVALDFGPPQGKPLRIGLIIAGAVSLGSYEAGALTALVGLVERSEGQILIDTIVGASAGSITGLLLAHLLLKGKDERDQEALWVDKTDMDILLKRGTIPGRPDGPLSPKRLLDWAARQLDAGGTPIQTEPIWLVMSIANLQGLSFRMAAAGRDETVRADTYRDASAFVMTPDSATTEWTRAMEVAAASSAHAFAFSSVRIPRSKGDYPPEIEWIDGTTGFWYTDGGTVYNEPFGMALDAVYSPWDVKPDVRKSRNLGQGNRLFLLIHPHPDDPLSPWPADGSMPMFARSGLRAFNMQRSQSLYEDLLKLEKYNGRLKWRAALENALREHQLEDEPWAEELAAAVAADREARHERTKLEGRGSEEEPPHPAKSNLTTILDAATGTAGKQPAYVEVVDPNLDSRVRTDDPAKKKSIRELLAGEGLGHFLGFTDVRARRSDFRLGYENLTTWWTGDDTLVGFRAKTGFGQLDVPGHDCLRWPWEGDFNLGEVPLGKRLKWAFKLVPRYLRAVRALLKGSKGPKKPKDLAGPAPSSEGTV